MTWAERAQRGERGQLRCSSPRDVINADRSPLEFESEREASRLRALMYVPQRQKPWLQRDRRRS